ncbi:unnamed protein product [Colias eurytheme]|nr:unnamed protein product [Colias eurytheme]
MSEEHDEKCVTSEKEDEQCATASTEVPENREDKEPSANTSAIEDSLQDVVETKGTLCWTEEGAEYRVSWTLPEGTATPKDYVALCLTVVIIYSSGAEYGMVDWTVKYCYAKEVQVTTPRWTHEWAARAPLPAIRFVNEGTGACLAVHVQSRRTAPPRERMFDIRI